MDYLQNGIAYDKKGRLMSVDFILNRQMEVKLTMDRVFMETKQLYDSYRDPNPFYHYDQNPWIRHLRPGYPLHASRHRRFWIKMLRRVDQENNHYHKEITLPRKNVGIDEKFIADIYLCYGAPMS
jgi:hypothetical protein